jgi:hypothetical protein
MTKIFMIIRAALAGVIWLCLTTQAPAQVILTENFDTITGNIPGPGWFAQNNSTTPIGTTVLQGSPGVFPAQSGAADSYAAMNFNATTSTSTSAILSVWLVTPMITLDNGTEVSFYTRTVSSVSFPDRLQVRFSTNGASTNVGSMPTDVGDFTNLMFDINPTYSTAPFPTGYPTSWQNFTGTISGLGGPVMGRVAFRYFVENGGPNGLNSEYIGIDTLTITAIPEPTSLALCGLAAGWAAWRRRRLLHRP